MTSSNTKIFAVNALPALPAAFALIMSGSTTPSHTTLDAKPSTFNYSAQITSVLPTFIPQMAAGTLTPVAPPRNTSEYSVEAASMTDSSLLQLYASRLSPRDLQIIAQLMGRLTSSIGDPQKDWIYKSYE